MNPIVINTVRAHKIGVPNKLRERYAIRYDGLMISHLRYPREVSLLASAIFCSLGVRSGGGLTPLVSAILVRIFDASLVLDFEISQRGDSGSRVHEKRRKTSGATETILISLQEAINQPEKQSCQGKVISQS